MDESYSYAIIPHGQREQHRLNYMCDGSKSEVSYKDEV